MTLGLWFYPWINKMSTINSSFVFTWYTQCFTYHKNNIEMLPACILGGSIHKWNSYWFGIIPFFFTSDSILQTLTCISGTHSYPVHSGIPYYKCEPNSFSGIGNMAVCRQEPDYPRMVPPSPGTEHLLWVGCRLLHPAYSSSFSIHFRLNNLRKELCSNTACYPLQNAQTT